MANMTELDRIEERLLVDIGEEAVLIHDGEEARRLIRRALERAREMGRTERRAAPGR